MKEAVFEFQLLTPAIIAGADQQSAEMRIPSIRGALRWWARLIFGEEYENEIFGFVKGKTCTQSKAFFRLLNANQRILKSQNAQSLAKDKYDYFLWPLKQQAKEGLPPNTRGVLDAGSRFKVSCKMKPGTEMWAGLIKCFLLFGSLGTRSRRAYGSIWPVSATFDGKPWEIPRTADELIGEADEFFDNSNVSIYRLASSGKKDYRDAIRCCSDFLKKIRCGKTADGVKASAWGEHDHDALQKKHSIYRAVLGLPLIQQFSSSHRQVEYSIAGWDRLASPLHFKVVKLKEGFVPLLLVIPEYAPVSGTKVHARVKKNGKDFDLTLDTDLLDFLIGATPEDENSLKKDFGAEQLAWYVESDDQGEEEDE